MKVWILVLIIIFAVNAFAESEELSHLQHRECNLSLLAEIPTSIGIFGHLKGISYRNYLGNIPEMTGEMQIQAMQQLIQPWGQRIYAVNSVEEARAKNEMMIHRNIPPEKRDSNHYISPPEAYLFVLTNEDPDSYFKFYDHKPEKHHEIDAYFRRLAAETEVFYFDLAGNKVNLTEEEVHQIKNIHYNMNNEKDHFFYFTGWFSPLYIGVESIQRFKTSENNPQKYSNAYKTLSKLMRKLYEQGVRVTFNRDMDKVLQLAGLQERIGKSNKVSKKTDVEKTRFKKSFRDAYLALQATGNSYSVEVWSGDPDDPNTQLIGGTFGTMTGSYVKVDSLAYVSTRKVRNFNENKEALFIIGNGILVTATEVDKKIYELRQTELKKGNSGEKLMQMSNNGYFTPRPSYVWEDASKDQTGPDGNVEYLLDEKGEIKETPRGEYGDLANFALYVILEQNGIDLVNVGMVSPKSHDTYKARYEFLPDALKAFNQQQQAFGDRNIVFPTGYFQPE